MSVYLSGVVLRSVLRAAEDPRAAGVVPVRVVAGAQRSFTSRSALRESVPEWQASMIITAYCVFSPSASRRAAISSSRISSLGVSLTMNVLS